MVHFKEVITMLWFLVIMGYFLVGLLVALILGMLYGYKNISGGLRCMILWPMALWSVGIIKYLKRKSKKEGTEGE